MLIEVPYNKIVVYAHRRKDTGEIFYIGYGWFERAFDQRARTDDWKLEAVRGYSIEILGFFTEAQDRQARDAELELLRLYRPTCNVTGTGRAFHTEEHKEKNAIH